MTSQTTTNSELMKVFIEETCFAIQEGLAAALEAPVDEETQEPDWSAYDPLKNVILQGVETAFNNALLVLEKKHKAELAKVKTNSPAKAIKSKSKSKTSGGTRAPNPYARWVSMASAVRAGKITGDDVVTVGEHFKDHNSISAKKYHGSKEDLEIDGQAMTVRELLDAIKDIPETKDMTLNAISWGLVAQDRRTELALAYES
jgi:hypothetical protein